MFLFASFDVSLSLNPVHGDHVVGALVSAQHRRLLYELFAANYRVRRKVIQTRLAQEFGDHLAKTDVDRLLKVSPCLTQTPTTSSDVSNATTCHDSPNQT